MQNINRNAFNIYTMKGDQMKKSMAPKVGDNKNLRSQETQLHDGAQSITAHQSISTNNRGKSEMHVGTFINQSPVINSRATHSMPKNEKSSV